MKTNTEKEGSRMMYNPETGKQGPVPYSKVEEAFKAGAEFTTHMYNPETGGQGWVANSKVQKALDAGATLSGVPMPKSPFEIKKEEDDKIKAEQLKGVGERTMDILSNYGVPLAIGAASLAAPFAAFRAARMAPAWHAAARAQVATGTGPIPAIGRALTQGAQAAKGGARWLAKNVAEGSAKLVGAGATAFGANAVDDILGGPVKEKIRESFPSN